MEDKRYSNPISCWCYLREPGKEYMSGPPVACRMEACERYRPAHPSCIHMEQRGRRGFRIPD